MSPTIFLHIGYNKTGTTAIQRHLARNTGALLQSGVLYPSTGRDRIAHHMLADSIGFGPRKKSDDEIANNLRELREELEQEIRTCGPIHSVVISSEMFRRKRLLAYVKELFESYSVRVLVYLRRHDQWCESVYNQAVKSVPNPPWGRGFEAFLEYQRTKGAEFGYFSRTVDHWANAFGKENVIVRPFEDVQNTPNITADCLRSIGCFELAQAVPEKQESVNVSLPSIAVLLIDRYQRMRLPDSVRLKLIEYTRKITRNRRRTSVVAPEVRKRLVQENFADYEYIAREYLGRVDGRLFYEPLPDAADSRESAPVKD